MREAITSKRAESAVGIIPALPLKIKLIEEFGCQTNWWISGSQQSKTWVVTNDVQEVPHWWNCIALV